MDSMVYGVVLSETAFMAVYVKAGDSETWILRDPFSSACLMRLLAPSVSSETGDSKCLERDYFNNLL